MFKGYVRCQKQDYVAKAEMYIDGELMETANLPASYTTRRNELFWKYELPKGKHVVTFKWLNPIPDAAIVFGDAVVYSDAPMQITHQ